jgi:hypothetical protein
VYRRVKDRVMEEILISFHNCAFDFRGRAAPLSDNSTWLA